MVTADHSPGSALCRAPPRRDRQSEPERAAAARLARDADLAPVRLYDLLGEKKAKSRAPRGTVRHLEILVEDRLVVLPGNPRPLVDHLESNAAVDRVRAKGDQPLD